MKTRSSFNSEMRAMYVYVLSVGLCVLGMQFTAIFFIFHVRTMQCNLWLLYSISLKVQLLEFSYITRPNLYRTLSFTDGSTIIANFPDYSQT